MNKKIKWEDLIDFTPAQKSKELVPTVSISKTGSLKFNEDFFTVAKIKDRNIKSLRISFSKNNQAIVLIVKNIDALNSFKFVGKSKSNIKVKSFFDQFKIDYKKHVGKYSLVLEKIPKKGMSWIIHLGDK